MSTRIHPTGKRTNLRSLSHQVVWTKEDDASSCHLLPHDRPPLSITSSYRSPRVLTVWKRSSMSFQGTDGFMVFDWRGRLVFRVDNYTRTTSRFLGNTMAGGGGSIVLMDGSGKPLLTLKPQMLSMQYKWNAYKGEGESEKIPRESNKVFTMKRTSALICRSRSCEAEIFMRGADHHINNNRCDFKRRTPLPDLRVEGSFRERNCKIIKVNTNTSTTSIITTGVVAAKIARKRSVASHHNTILLGDDIFTVLVQPGFDPELIMAFIIILDRISSNSNPFTSVICY